MQRASKAHGSLKTPISAWPADPIDGSEVNNGGDIDFTAVCRFLGVVWFSGSVRF